MKSILTLFLSFPILCFAQSIQETCVSLPANGTVVDFEMFNDTLYATGFFSSICGEQAAFIATWDQGIWTPSPLGLTDPGHSLNVIDEHLYIARYEESIDSNWVYVYDGDNLETMGQGVYLTTASGFSELPNIYSIIEFNDEIYACGEFDRVGTASISGIMKWNGTAWTDVGGGLSGNIQNSAPVMFPHTMVVFENELYVGGNFRFAGATEVNGLAKWDGTNWSAMDGGFNSTVYGLGIFNNTLYAGGSFTSASGNTLNRIARWNGSSWESPGFGFIENSAQDFIFVHTLESIDNDFFIAGGLKKVIYDDMTEELCNGVVSFDGSALNTYEGGVPGNDIEAIAKSNENELLFGGGVFGAGYTGILSSNSLFESEVESALTIYPNPSTDYIQIASKHPFQIIACHNLAGEHVRLNLDQNRIDVRSMDSGIYFITIKLSNKFLTYKIGVQ